MEPGGSGDLEEDRTERAVADRSAVERRTDGSPATRVAPVDETVVVGPDDTIPVAGLADAAELDLDEGARSALRTASDGSYSRSAILNATGEGLDPERRVVSAPAGPDGEPTPSPAPAPGVSHRLPVVYGARTTVAHATGRGVEAPALGSEHRFGLEALPDERGGVDGPRLWIDRSGLPSLARREQRRRAMTRAAYAAVCVAAILGLIAVAVVALG